MVNANLPGRWLIARTFDELTDKAWRIFTNALMYSAEQGTDGFLHKRSLRFLHPEGVDGKTANELAQADLWRPEGDGYQLLDWNGKLGQSLATEVEEYRIRARDKKRAQRAKAKARHVPQDQINSVSGDVPRGRPRRLHGDEPGGRPSSFTGDDAGDVVEARQGETRPRRDESEDLPAAQAQWPPVKGHGAAG